MGVRVRSAIAAGLVVAALSAGASFAQGARAARDTAAVESIVHDYLAKHPEEIEKIVREYLLKHPELMHAAIIDFAAKRAAAHAKQATTAPPVPPAPPTDAARAAAVKSHADALFASAHQAVVGNRDGAITMVEFFDYNCGYCKRALADMLALIEHEPKLKVVLKEFPVLGQGSAEAARVAVAVRMQDADGARYLDFHRRLLGAHGPANRDTALAAAREAGLDMARLERDMASEEVRATIAENFELAKALGINGTPSYVIGDDVVIGAVGLPALQGRLAALRR